MIKIIIDKRPVGQRCYLPTLANAKKRGSIDSPSRWDHRNDGNDTKTPPHTGFIYVCIGPDRFHPFVLCCSTKENPRWLLKWEEKIFILIWFFFIPFPALKQAEKWTLSLSLPLSVVRGNRTNVSWPMYTLCLRSESRQFLLSSILHWKTPIIWFPLVSHPPRTKRGILY